ncbi:helix-turn-helix transcriptional regulator [Cedecea sp. S5-13]|uniref:helix-turn-helix transcriptional regulator n=1 Tax=Cedecea selenatireducens TaxID=3144416 RepID=UPI0035CD069E
MLKEIIFVGANFFLAKGVATIINNLEHLIPERYSVVILVEPEYCYQISKAQKFDDDALIVILMDHKNDFKLFQMPGGFSRAIYVVAKGSCEQLYDDLKVAFTNSDEGGSLIHNCMYKDFFSHRETMLITLIMENYSFSSISTILNISMKSVYYCRSEIMRKLNVSNVVGMYNKVQQIRNMRIFLT